MRANKSALVDLMVCPRCQMDLGEDSGTIHCSNGACFYSRRPFSKVDDTPMLVDFPSSILDEAKAKPNALASPIARQHEGKWRKKAKRFVFRSSRISENMAFSVLNEIKRCAERPILLIVGGAIQGFGVDILYADPIVQVISFDIYATTDVDFIADAHSIPLRDGSVDCVWIQAVLEHVVQPEKVVSEIARVIKVGGCVYGETPFMQQVHEGPYDFTRFTHSGHRWLFRQFDELQSGIVGGAGTQLLWTLYYFSRALFRAEKIGKVFRLLFCWLPLLDNLCSAVYSRDTASGFYFFGRRANKIVHPRDLPAYYYEQREGK